MVQWLRIHLARQGTLAWSLVQEDPACLKATKPKCHNYWAHGLQLERVPCSQRSLCSEQRVHEDEEKPPPAATRESPRTATETHRSQKYISKSFKEKKIMRQLGKLEQCVIIFSSVQLLSCIWHYATPWTAAHQASLSMTNSQSLLRLMSIESDPRNISHIEKWFIFIIFPSTKLYIEIAFLLPQSVHRTWRFHINVVLEQQHQYHLRTC